MKAQNLPLDPQITILRILHQKHTYSIAWLAFGKNHDHVLGERWDGETETDAGYPLGRGGRPKWMIIAKHLVKPRLRALIGEDGTDNEAVLWALQDFNAHSSGALVSYGNTALVGCPTCGELFMVSAFARSFFTPRTLDVIDELEAHPMTEAQVAEKLSETPRYIHEVVKNLLPGGPNVGAGIVAIVAKDGVVTLTRNRECPHCSKSVAYAEYDDQAGVSVAVKPKGSGK